MKEIRELTWKELKHSCLPSDFSFKTTDELEELDDFIGQERAKKAIKFGLSVKVQGYNIYMSGEPGTGKTAFARLYTKKEAKLKRIPDDWCYVYNFKNPKVPMALCFEPGDGKLFQDDMNELIEYLTNEIPSMYSEKEYEVQRNNIVERCQEEKELYINKFKKQARQLGFLVQFLKEGVSLTPLKDNGKLMSEEEFESLEPSYKKMIEDNSKKLQDVAQEVADSMKDVDKGMIEAIENLDYEIGLKCIGCYIKILKEKYECYEKVSRYLDDLQNDMLENIEAFITSEEGEEESIMSLLPWYGQRNIKDITGKYGVNLLVDNSNIEEAPVIEEANISYGKLIGELEYYNEFGTLSTDFMRVKAGLLHKANGGYLILQAEDVLSNYEVWLGIKKVLRSGKIQIENPSTSGIMTISTLRPEPIPIDVKIILVGSSRLYNLMYEYDSDFEELFKVRADFDSELKNDKESKMFIARFIRTYCEEKFLLPFTTSAVSEVVRYASRYVENKNKVTAEFRRIADILVESSCFAEAGNSSTVKKMHVIMAIKEKEDRERKYEERLDELLQTGVMMIDTKGDKCGQINALAVYEMGGYRFGRPVKVTATTYKGQSGIINIEKEANLSGDIHTKGIQVIGGYLGQSYAQDFPLSLSCRICFEQSYSGIDGDSASSAELYTILSSLSEVPIKQNIAVTGSVNQYGQIQAVGGVTHKVEGFFTVCKTRGLTGKEGVIIPKSNISDLVLKDEIIEAVKQNKFHIYAVESIEEGIEILTGMDYEVIDDKVAQKLKKLYTVNKKIK